MNDELIITPHPYEEKSYYELREQFRAENLARVRSKITEYIIPRGDYEAITPFKIMPDRHTMEAHKVSSDGKVTLIETDLFPPLPANLLEQASELAEESLVFDAVDIPGGVDHDGPACPKLDSMTDAEICEYVATTIERSQPDGR